MLREGPSLAHMTPKILQQSCEPTVTRRQNVSQSLLNCFARACAPQQRYSKACVLVVTNCVMLHEGPSVARMTPKFLQLSCELTVTRRRNVNTLWEP